MTDDPEVGSLAEELRSLARVLAERSEDGAEGLLRTIREHLAGTQDRGDEPDVDRVDIS